MKSPARQFCFLTLLLSVFALGLVSCEKSSQNSNGLVSKTLVSEANANKFDIAEFERNRNLWTSRNIQNYKMIIGASGFITNFPEEVLIEVRNREAASIKSLSKTGRNGTDTYKKFDTIEKIFDFVENNQKGHKLDVAFDKTSGYPSKIIYDGQADIADDELQLEVKSLEVIK